MSTKQSATRKKTRRRCVPAIAFSALAFSMAACSTGPAGAGTDSAVKIDAMKPVTQFVGPTESFKPSAGKRIMILVCGNFGLGCVREAQGAKAAAEALGWKADMVDGRLDPTVWNRAVKQAVDSGVDGIVSVAADPNLMGQAMAAVNAKKIPFVVISQTPKKGDVPGVGSWIRPDAVKGGKIVGDWINKDSDGKANLLVLDLPDYADIMLRNNSIAQKLKSDCKGCTVRRATVSSQTMGTSLATLVTAQLQKHPDVKYVWSPDDALTNFVAQGIQQAGKTQSVRLVSGAGAPDALARIKQGTQAADLATPDDYMGWLATDSMARIFSGRPVQKVWDVPQRFFSAENIDDGSPEMTKRGWYVEFHYPAQFQKLWGKK